MDQEISYNTIREFWVTESHAWGGDGGAIEMDDGRNDYHLRKDSPLRGKGINLSEFYSVDHGGNPLPKLGAWDIGAFQTASDH
jgi:hypothetical protein